MYYFKNINKYVKFILFFLADRLLIDLHFKVGPWKILNIKTELAEYSAMHHFKNELIQT